MSERVASKKVLITGAAQGLGEASAMMLARHGARLVLTDINIDGARAVAEKINQTIGPETALALRLDVCVEDAWVDVVARADAALGGISVLVNNAGIFTPGSVEDLSLEEWRRTMAVNADSVFLGAKHALRVMREHQPGSIINISSISGLIAAHNFAAYNASKAAVWMVTKSIALHCAKQGLDIRCNSIHPAFVRTPILDAVIGDRDPAQAQSKLTRQVPLGRLGEPDDVAYAVLYLASDESRFMTAAELKLDGGISAM